MNMTLSQLALIVALFPCLSILVYQGITGVPPLPSSEGEASGVIALLRQTGLKNNAIVYELGSGWGSLVIALARAFPEARIRGIELSPLPYWVARFRTRKMPNVTLQRANFFDCDLTDAQAVSCYLMSKPMPRLAHLLDRMLKPGTPVVSIMFRFRGRDVAAVSNGPGTQGATALYRWPARKINDRA
jgi:hypothetical protein